MSSSVHDHSSNSDNSGDDESQKQSEPYLQSEFNASEMVHPNMPSSSAEYMVPAHLQIGHAVAQAGYPYPDPYYRSIFAPYGAQPMIHPHTMGMQAAVPLPSDAVEPVYVNAKQYHGIMRRRKSRAKAESENKMLKCRKPYLHESRHLHALKRARGCGGRFLNAKTGENEQNEADSHDKAQSNTGNLDENLNSYGNDINRQN